MLRNDRACSFGVCAAVSLTDADQPPLVVQPTSHRIVATFGHLANRLSKPAHERPYCAYPPRCVQNHNGLRAFEP